MYSIVSSTSIDLWDFVDDVVIDFTDFDDSMTDFVCTLCTDFDVLTHWDFIADETFTDCSTMLDAESFTEKNNIQLFLFTKKKKRLLFYTNLFFPFLRLFFCEIVSFFFFSFILFVFRILTKKKEKNSKRKIFINTNWFFNKKKGKLIVLF